MVEEFKNTDYGVIPNDWNLVPLGDVCLKVQDGNYGESYPKSNEFVKIGVPFLTSKAIGKNGVLKNHLIDFITEKKHSVLAKAHLSLHDVLFTNRGASVGAIGFVNERIANGNIGPQLTLLRANKACLEPLYLFQVMKSKFVQKQILGQDSGSAMNFFGIGSTKKFQIPIPHTKAEQTTIATALNDADALISKLEKLIAKKRNIKQGTMQELLKPKEGWEAKKLGEIAEINMGQSPDSINYNSSGEGKPLIQGNADIENRKSIKRVWTKQITKTCEQHDLIMTVRAPVGAIGIASENSCIGRGVCSFKITDVDKYFLYHLLIFKETDWKILEQGSTFTSANSNQIFGFELSIPKDEPEQNRIAQILSDMDTEIEALEKKLEKYKMIKQGMMQNLLTGKIRLV